MKRQCCHHPEAILQTHCAMSAHLKFGDGRSDNSKEWQSFQLGGKTLRRRSCCSRNDSSKVVSIPKWFYWLHICKGGTNFTSATQERKRHGMKAHRTCTVAKSPSFYPITRACA